jgi:hypothetical protein
LFIPTATAAGVVGITDLRFSLCLRYVPQMKLRAFAAMAAWQAPETWPQWMKSSRQGRMGTA